MMKKLTALVLTLAVMLTLCACGKKEQPPVQEPQPAAETAAPAEAAPAAADSSPKTGAAPSAETAATAAEAEALFNSGDYAAAFQKALTLADSGDVTANALLGKAYYLGLGTGVNYARALPCLQTAAAGGNAPAAYLLADAADRGNGTRRDPDEAAKRFIKFVAFADDVDPASSDYGMAMTYLCDCYARGRGVEKKHSFALDAASKAVAAANLTPFELMSLAAYYDSPMPNHVSNAADAANSDNSGVETARKIDAALAEQLYTRAVPGIQRLADAGNLAALKLLGDLYLDGKGGLEKDYALARENYLLAADEEYAPAQAQLGYIYQNALGVDADYAAAMDWNSRAAEQGDPQGQAQIGYLYHNGLGVTQNLDEAGRWYTRAVEGGSEWAAAMLERTEATNPHASFEAHA